MSSAPAPPPRPLRVLLAAFGDAGHLFPVLALARKLRARGHDTTIETYRRWRPEIEADGHHFAAAPEYVGSPEQNWLLPPFQVVERATAVTRELIRLTQPDVVVSDILTLAPALAAELEGVPIATVIPHVDPRPQTGHPPYSLGVTLPRTAAGGWFWRRFDPMIQRGSLMGRDDLNETRRRVGLPPQPQVHNGISRDLAIVATFPQLEYPGRDWQPNTHVVGPLQWEPASGDVDLPHGDPSWPLVLVAPSTAQDPRGRLLTAALRGLSGLPLRVLATTNGRPPAAELHVGANVRLVDWLSYERTMALSDVVVCHGGHGTLVRALSSGAVPVVWPAYGDMGENAARARWAGAAVHLPRRFLGPGGLRLAVQRALAEPDLRARALELAAWSRAHDPAVHAAELVESLAAGDRAADPAATIRL